MKRTVGSLVLILLVSTFIGLAREDQLPGSGHTDRRRHSGPNQAPTARRSRLAARLQPAERGLKL